MKKFLLFQSGIFYGNIYFDGEDIFHERLNVFENVLEKKKILSQEDYEFYLNFTKIDMKVLSERLPIYEEVFLNSKEDSLETPFLEKFFRYKNMWVERERKFPLDIVVEDNKIVGINCSAREWCTTLVEEGYEKYTSLSIWRKNYPNEKIYPVEFLGTMMIDMRDGVKLSTNVYLPVGRKEGKASCNTSENSLWKRKLCSTSL